MFNEKILRENGSKEAGHFNGKTKVSMEINLNHKFDSTDYRLLT